ncbi:DUF6069 family protein [Glycomyces dulcitolivorans]|uniref:DUF6069 family protein n=1 Tax=Glycomyces dulcitolivorans TaxID=2200759 RepID=UPI000DD39F65|nr:DUF6069 family protein [Glycomyces dulcitolivorans]
MSTSTTSLDSTAAPTALRLPRLLAAAGAAAALNLVALGIGSAADASMIVNDPTPTEVGVAATLGATLGPLLVAGLVLWLIAKRSPRIRVWAGWAGAVLAFATVASPFFAADDLTTAFTLASMHIVGGLAWLAATRPWDKPATR